MRCLASAETLAWASWDVGFVSTAETVATVPALGRAGFQVREDHGGSVSGADVIVFDHYGLDAQVRQRLAADTPIRVAFEDLPVRAHDVDILVDPTPGRDVSAYADVVRPDTALLAGPRYAQLRRPWWAARGATAAQAARAKAARVLVSMGATDPANATRKVLAGLAALGRTLEIDVVLGPGAPHRDAVRDDLRGFGRLHVDPPDLPRLVAEADLVIGAGGSSGYERACLGVPALIVVLADNQVDLARAFEASGVARTIPYAMLGEPQALAAAIADVLDDADLRHTMARKGRELVDGRGPQRLLLHLAGREPVAGGHVRLRLAEASDRDGLLDLQSRPETRRFAREPKIPTPAEHAAWFDMTLANPDRLLAIIDAGGTNAGMLRIDRLVADNLAFEVSIAVSPEMHGRGIGRSALALLRRVVPKADLLATILAGNAASRALFARAGYRPEGDERFRSVA
jgi:UDP-2,4-diacetamido-2,4,6-trideoxy-beta-L-altropyranose hydrolase